MCKATDPKISCIKKRFSALYELLLLARDTLETKVGKKEQKEPS